MVAAEVQDSASKESAQPLRTEECDHRKTASEAVESSKHKHGVLWAVAIVLAFTIGYTAHPNFQISTFPTSGTERPREQRELSRALATTETDADLVAGCKFSESRVVSSEEDRMKALNSTLLFSDKHKHLNRLPGEIGSLKASQIADVKKIPADDAWKHCLPMSARVCNTGTMDMLLRDTPFPIKDGEPASGSSPQSKVCISSVLHLMLETWAVMRDIKCEAMLMHGTMLGAVRDQDIIAYTPDVDIGFFPSCDLKALGEGLWQKGYLLLWRGMYSWCIAGHHPLARYIYDPNKETVLGPRNQQPPYGDLYTLQPVDATEQVFRVQQFQPNVTRDKIFPKRCARVYNNEYPIFRDAEWWLTNRYNDKYMVPARDKLELEKQQRGIKAQN